MCAKPAIKAGAESQRRKQDAPELTPSTLRDKLWRIGSPFPQADYTPPLAKIAAELAARLERELAVCASRASAAADLEYAGCAAHLIRVAPRVYDVLAEIRGLALTRNPEMSAAGALRAADSYGDALGEDSDDEKETLPGEVLVYESIRYPAAPAV
jgi:hypothetical protein